VWENVGHAEENEQTSEITNFLVPYAKSLPPKGPCFLELPRDKPPPRIISNNCRHGGNLVETWWKLGGTIVETWWKPGGK
jgi:hypothetical protein